MATSIIDPAFTGAGRREGLEIWRIEKFEPKEVEALNYGKFYTGDSYILLSTKITKAGGFTWNIHFWIGSKSSQDEYGTAAIKSVELDDYLGGGPVQHREVQGNESKEFLSNFPKGIQYLEGGHATGFRKVEKEDIKILYHLKGKKNIRMTQVPLVVSSLNHGDAFVLDLGSLIFVWLGLESGRMERIKAVDAARNIRDDERAGKAKVEIIDETTQDEDAEFMKFIGGKDSGEIGPSTPDETSVRATAALVSLHHISDASGSLEMKEIGSRPLEQSMLNSDDSYILDSGSGAIWAWIGKGATKAERKSAMSYALQFIKEKGYPNSTQVSRVIDGAEPVVFKSYFKAWQDKDEVENIFASRKSEFDDTPKEETIKADELASEMQKRAKIEEEKLFDDGQGKSTIWRVENFEMAPVDPKTYGQFYSGDSYLILYEYIMNGKQYYTIYFWQGQESSQDEREAAALHAVALDDKYEGAPVQVRVVQGKEPAHFMKIFEGKFIIHSGGKASGFHNLNEKDYYDTDGIRFYQIQSLSATHVKAVQVLETASVLNSGDAFFLESPEDTFIWVGKGANEREIAMANSTAKILTPNRNPVTLKEGYETDIFWNALGGYKTYAKFKTCEAIPPSMEPRLFQVSNASGSLKVEEIAEFMQEDLDEDDVMILDTFDEIFVWIGNNANQIEKKGALQIVKEYISTDPSGRLESDTTLLQINQSHEPLGFTGRFQAWNYNLWNQSKSFEAVKNDINLENLGCSVDEALSNYGKVFNFDELQNVPFEGVDSTRKEDFLKPEEFESIFNMTRKEFDNLPKWKRINIKKKLDLF